MATRQIDCITREYPNSGDITHVGGPRGRNGRWHYPVSTVANRIRSEGWYYYVRRNGRDVKVDVSYRNGRPYLHTVPDGISLNNLLSRSTCT